MKRIPSRPAMKNRIISNPAARMWSSVIAGLVVACLNLGEAEASPPLSHSPAGQTQDPPPETKIYTCPMHPSVRQQGPGRCPICGMDLTLAGNARSSPSDDGRGIFHVSPGKQQAIGVKYDTVAVRLLRKTVRAVGNVTIDERRVAIVNLRYSGWIDSVAADYNGKFVSRGDLLFRIYSPEAVAAQREHLLSRAYASDTSWTVDALLGGSDDLGSATRQRLSFLGFTDGQIGALEERGEVSNTVEILSPIAGNIIEKSTTAGMYVEPGTNLYTIADLSTVWLNAEIYQNELPDVRVDQEAVIRFGQIPGRNFTGKVKFLNPTLDRSTRSAKARIEVPNGDGALKPGMYGNVTLHTGGVKKLSVSVDAVMNTGTREIVFVAGGGDVIEARIVRTGFRNDDRCEILSGLAAGERVISSANFLIDAESRIQGVLDRLLEPGRAPGKERNP